VRFVTCGAGMVFLTDSESVMVLSRRKNTPDASDEIEQTVIPINLDRANVPRSFDSLEKLESIFNYSIGNTTSKWVTNVPNYRQTTASGVYPGIALVYYGDARQPGYDFAVRSGPDSGHVHFPHEGAGSLTTYQQGNLLAATRLRTLVQRNSLVYQEINGEHRDVRSSYSIRTGKIESAPANWHCKHDLMIDHVLGYSAYLDGSRTDCAHSTAVESTVTAYVTGNTSSTNVPRRRVLTRPGRPDSKFRGRKDGRLSYSSVSPT